MMPKERGDLFNVLFGDTNDDFVECPQTGYDCFGFEPWSLETESGCPGTTMVEYNRNGKVTDRVKRCGRVCVQLAPDEKVIDYRAVQAEALGVTSEIVHHRIVVSSDPDASASRIMPPRGLCSYPDGMPPESR